MKFEIEKDTKTLAKFNSSSIKLDSILMIEKDYKAGMRCNNGEFEIGESSNSRPQPIVL